MPNVFVLAHDAFNRRALDTVERASDYRFHPLLSYEQVKRRHHGVIDELLDRATDELERFERSGRGSVDGIVGFWDFPVQTMVAILRRRRSLPGPTLESVMKCEHKYWSRLEQQEAIPEQIPAFAVFDPFDDDPSIGLELPCWIKPIKSTASELCFLVSDEGELQHALDTIRARIDRFGVSFGQLMAHADLPDEIAAVSGHHCIAEGVMQGEQHTLTGYVDGGAVEVYGVVDSLNYPGTSSFSRYQYPSRLPDDVQARMGESAARVIDRVGFDHEAFNVEFFYDRAADALSLLEVNPRMSQSHGPLFDKVDGSPDHRIVADLAVGRRPDFPRRQGPFACAAKCYLRQFGDAVVTRAPDAETVARVEREVPGSMIDLKVSEGTRLSQMAGQDAYSFALAHIYVAGDSEDDLTDAYERCVVGLGIELEVRA